MSERLPDILDKVWIQIFWNNCSMSQLCFWLQGTFFKNKKKSLLSKIGIAVFSISEFIQDIHNCNILPKNWNQIMLFTLWSSLLKLLGQLEQLKMVSVSSPTKNLISSCSSKTKMIAMYKSYCRLVGTITFSLKLQSPND